MGRFCALLFVVAALAVPVISALTDARGYGVETGQLAAVHTERVNHERR